MYVYVSIYVYCNVYIPCLFNPEVTPQREKKTSKFEEFQKKDEKIYIA